MKFHILISLFYLSLLIGASINYESCQEIGTTDNCKSYKRRKYENCEYYFSGHCSPVCIVKCKKCNSGAHKIVLTYDLKFATVNYKQCLLPIPHCIEYNTGMNNYLSCNKCADKYNRTFDTSSETHYHVICSIPNCVQTNMNNNVLFCERCENNYLVSENMKECIICPDICKKCLGFGSCKCWEEIGSSYSYPCENCLSNENKEHCIACNELASANCSQCEPQYRVNSYGKCIYISAECNIQNCGECRYPNKCTRCSSGFLFHPLNQCLSNCPEFTLQHNAQCLCPNNTTYNLNAGTCMDNCLLEYNNCQICDHSRTVCEKCKQGFALESNKENPRCVNCTQIINNCIQCNDLNTCLSCSPGMYLYKNSSQQRCLGCPKDCTSCNGKDKLGCTREQMEENYADVEISPMIVSEKEEKKEEDKNSNNWIIILGIIIIIGTIIILILVAVYCCWKRGKTGEDKGGKYISGEGENMKNSNENSPKETEEGIKLEFCCPICLEEVNQVKIPICKLPCGHEGFHLECIRNWTKYNKSCPLCRTPIPNHLLN